MWSTWIPPVAYAALIFYFSSIRGLALPVDVNHGDKLAHVLEYGGFGLLLFRAGWRTGSPSFRARVPLLTVGVGALVAMADEFYQGTVGRTRSPWDWAADVVGLTAAAFISHRLATASDSRRAGRDAEPGSLPSHDAGREGR